MTNRISGPGIGLPAPTTLYPNTQSVQTIPNYEAATNYASVAPGEVVYIPPGDWWYDISGNVVSQYLDPVTGIWRGYSSARLGPKRIFSDGNNWRLFNPTGCPVAAIVTAQGSGYVQATTTVTPSAGNSTWYPVIGGAISTTITIVGGGTNYSIAPQVYFPAPANPGVTAQGYATISGGAVTGVTVTNCGAGYTTAPVPVFIPSPADPNLASITAASATSTISASAGKLCAVLCTNPGSSLASVPTLTVSGAGSSATCTAVSLCTITGSTGSGGTNYTTANAAMTIGGQSNATPVAAVVNPSIDLSAFIPRAAQGTATVSGGAITGFTFYDTGLFASSNFSSNQPTLLVFAQTGASAPAGALTITVTLGGAAGTVALQPA